MDKIRSYSLVSFILFIVLLITTGCNSFIGKSEPAQVRSISQVAESPKELNMKEVVMKSDQVMREAKGFRSKATVDQTFSLEGNDGITIGYKSQMEADVETTIQPLAIHLTANYSVMNQKMKSEVYLVDGQTYIKTDLTPWLKTEKTDLVDPSIQSSGYNNIFKEIVPVLESANSNTLIRGIKMKKENGSYHIELDYQGLEENFREEWLQRYGTVFESLFTTEMEDLKLDATKMTLVDFKKTVLINETNFKVTAIKQEIAFTISNAKQTATLTVEQRSNVKITGDYKGEVILPEDIKKKARSIQ